MTQHDSKSNTPQPAAASTEPKFVLSGNTIDELAIALAEVVLKSGGFIVKDNKSGNGNKYAAWKLDDGLATGPFSAGLGLTPEQAKRLPTQSGVPAILSMDIVMRQLTPLSQVALKATERAAATANRESKLLEELNRVRAARGEAPIAG